MTKFVAGKPQTTDVPRIVVDAGLPAGLHRFQLLVVDDQGNQSKADEAVVEVRAGRTTGGTIGGTVGGTTGVTVSTPVVRPSGVSPAPQGSISKASTASAATSTASTAGKRSTSVGTRARKRADKTGSKT